MIRTSRRLVAFSFVASAVAVNTTCQQPKAFAAGATLTQDELKKMVGHKAVDDYVKSGMIVGLGTGSTAYYAVERVGQKLKSGELKDVIFIPTSERTKEQALSLASTFALTVALTLARTLALSVPVSCALALGLT